MTEPSKSGGTGGMAPEPWPCPLPGDAGLKKQGDPLAVSLWLASVRSQQAAIVAALSDPDVLAGYLPQKEQDRYRAAQQSVIDARRWAEAHGHEFYVGGRP